MLSITLLAIVMTISSVESTSAASACASYNALDNTITVTCDTTISKIAAEINNTAALEEDSPKVWILRAILTVGSDAHLTINSSDVQWLKITVNNTLGNSSNTDGPNRIELYGTATFNNTKITSWDETANSEVQQLPDASIVRPFIKIGKGGGTADISNSELGYLGYEGDPKSHGLTYDEGGDGSVITNSSFHHMSYGIHPEGVGLMLENNDFHSNVVYGINAHGSPYIFVNNNRIYNNTGSAGMIFSQNSAHLMIENNEVYNNTNRGIRFSDNTHDSVIRNNTIYNQENAISINSSPRNQIFDNIIKDSRYGITLQTVSKEIDPEALCNRCGYSEVDAKSINNTVLGNDIQNAETAIRIKDNSTIHNLFEGNSLSDNRNHVTIESATYNTFRNNDIGPATQNEFKIEDDTKIVLENQSFTDDRIKGENGTNVVIIVDSGDIEVRNDSTDDEGQDTTAHNTNESPYTHKLTDNEVIVADSKSS